MNNHNFCFIITAYDQVDLVKANIVRIRRNYPSILKGVPIILVSTAEANLFEDIVSEDNIHFIHFKDAPSNKLNTTFKTIENPTGPYIDWRQEFLPPRILMSIEKGLNLAYKIGCSSALHLHSDTYWMTEKIGNLLDEINSIGDKLFIGDLSYPNEYASFRKKVLPPFIHFQPEGLHFNVIKAIETGFSNFSEIWSTNTHFKSHNYGSIEAMIGQYANYCLTGENVTHASHSLNAKYFSAIGFRTIRSYHGQFRYGLTNLLGETVPGLSVKERMIFPILERILKIIIKGKIK